MIPFNHLEELPDCPLYQVPRKKEHEDEFFTIFSDKNHFSPSSSTTEESSNLSDTDPEIIEVVTTTVTRITQEKSRKK